MRLLLVEDDHYLGEALQNFLVTQGYGADWVERADLALEAVVKEKYDLIILDLNLPDMSGLDVLKAIRGKSIKTPVIILTARDTLSDRVAGLDAGADDYIVKPFEIEEVAARLRAFKRRVDGQTQQCIEFGPLTMDTQAKEVFANQSLISLSVREYSVLEMLMNKIGHVVTKRQIVTALSKWDADFSENAVEVYIYRLRKRLEGVAVNIKTVRGFGYMLELPNTSRKRVAGAKK